MNKSLILVLLVLLLPLWAGCGSRNVKAGGHVLFPDGTPVTSGMIKFETPQEQYVGTIQQDGSFQLGGVKPGNGLPPGSYGVSIYDVCENGVPILDAKYESAETSGVVCEIASGKVEPIKITVERSAVDRTPPPSSIGQ